MVATHDRKLRRFALQKEIAEIQQRCLYLEEDRVSQTLAEGRAAHKVAILREKCDKIRTEVETMQDR